MTASVTPWSRASTSARPAADRNRNDLGPGGLSKPSGAYDAVIPVAYAIAMGSNMECAAIVDASEGLALIDGAKAREADDLLDSLVRMLSRLWLEPKVQDQVHVQVQVSLA